MSYRFNPPPGWPEPPAGWTPGPGWQPDPSWPPAPEGWEFWLPEDTPSDTADAGAQDAGEPEVPSNGKPEEQNAGEFEAPNATASEPEQEPTAQRAPAGDQGGQPAPEEQQQTEQPTTEHGTADQSTLGQDDAPAPQWAFNPPPGWPAPPAGWTPGPGWQPDPQWPPAPEGWEFWVPAPAQSEEVAQTPEPAAEPVEEPADPENVEDSAAETPTEVAPPVPAVEPESASVPAEQNQPEETAVLPAQGIPTDPTDPTESTISDSSHDQPTPPDSPEPQPPHPHSPESHSPQPQTAAMGQLTAPAPQDSPAKEKGSKGWLLAIIALIVGIALGAGGMFFIKQVNESDENQALRETLDARESELNSLEEDLDARTDELDALQDQLRDDARELEDERAEFDDERAEFDDQDPFLAGEVKEVGSDIDPGEYEVTGATHCYWARTSSTDPDVDDIISEGFIRGKGKITVKKKDEALVTLQCPDLKEVKDDDDD